MSSYTDLDIYTLAHDLGVSSHKLTLQLPKHETYEMGSQLRRASKPWKSNTSPQTLNHETCTPHLVSFTLHLVP